MASRSRTSETERFSNQFLLFSVDREGALAFGGTVELRDRNFMGRAIQASAGLRYDPDVRVATLLFSSPRTRGLPIRSSLYLRDGKETDRMEDGGRIEGLVREVTLEQRWRATPGIELTRSYGIARTLLRLSLEDTAFEFDGILPGPTVSVTFDRRDSPLDATRGWFHSSNFQLGLPSLGSDLGNYRYLVRQDQFVPAGPFVLAGSIRWGRLRGFSGTAPLSAVDLLFLAGGTNSVRGYSDGFFAPNQVGNIRLGGTDLLVANGEVRYPIYKIISGAAFVDAGNSFVDGVRLDDLAVGAGVGLRVRTPLVTFRVDLGFPVTSGLGVSGGRWHFSIGQMF